MNELFQMTNGGPRQSTLTQQGSFSSSRPAARSTNPIKLLYVTPERFSKAQGLQTTFAYLMKHGLLSRFVVDEAHCMSQWGHDFRPDYLSLKNLKGMYPDIPIMALTATANTAVITDSVKNLRMTNAFLYTMSFNRSNLHYAVKKKPAKKALISEIASYIRQREGMCGIIYCLSTKDCEDVCTDLQAELPHMANQFTFYHAKIEPQSERENRQRMWTLGRTKVIVATIAFGMGINKPDVRFVIHHCMPKSMDGFSQESGRAGRDGKVSESVVYFANKDVARMRSMIVKSADERGGRGGESKTRNLDLLSKTTAFCLDELECRRTLMLNYFGEEFDRANCGKTCDNCQREGQYQAVDMGHYAQKLLFLYEELRAGGDITVVMLSKIASGGKDKTLAKFLPLMKTQMPGKITRDMAERLLMLMVLKDFLKEEQKTAGSYQSYQKKEYVVTADYLALGSRAHLLRNTPPIDEQGRPVIIPVAVLCSPSTTAARHGKAAVAGAVVDPILLADDDNVEDRRGGGRKRALQPGYVDEDSTQNSSLGGGYTQQSQKLDSQALMMTGRVASPGLESGWLTKGSGSGGVAPRGSKAKKQRMGAGAGGGGVVPLALTLEREVRPAAKLSKDMSEELRDWLWHFRVKAANERRIQNYLKFISDSQLDELKDFVPVNRQDLLLIEGITESWLDQWEEQLLATIYAFLERYELLDQFPRASKPTLRPSSVWQDPRAMPPGP
jgi:bloom syndrome protein